MLISSFLGLLLQCVHRVGLNLRTVFLHFKNVMLRYYTMSLEDLSGLCVWLAVTLTDMTIIMI